MTTQTKTEAREKRQARWLARTMKQREQGEARRNGPALPPMDFYVWPDDDDGDDDPANHSRWITDAASNS